MLSKQQLALWGERWVVQQLQHQGWQVKAQNFCGRGYEIDILAIKESSLVAVEVKTRRKYPANFYSLLSYRKQRALFRGVHAFLQKYPEAHFQSIRVDLALILAHPYVSCEYFVDVVDLNAMFTQLA